MRWHKYRKWKQRWKQKLAGFLAVVLFLTGIQFPVCAEDPFADYLDGFRVQCSWSTLSRNYEWNALQDEARQPKLVVTYRLEQASRDYPAGSLQFEVPGIGGVGRGTMLRADQIQTEEESQWNCQWDERSDTYLYSNRFEVKQGQSLSGGFELMWSLYARNCQNGFSQKRSPVFRIDSAGSILLEPMTFTFHSERDRCRMKMERNQISGNDYDQLDSTYIWYRIETRFETDWLARGLYRSECRMRMELPVPSEPDALKIQKNGRELPLSWENDQEAEFFLFQNRYGNLGSVHESWQETFLIGIKRELLAGNTMILRGHIDRLYEDESRWTTAAASHLEQVDDELTFTIEDYGFIYGGMIYRTEKWNTSHENYPYGHQEPAKYEKRLNASALYQDQLLFFEIEGQAERNYMAARAINSSLFLLATPGNAEVESSAPELTAMGPATPADAEPEGHMPEKDTPGKATPGNAAEDEILLETDILTADMTGIGENQAYSMVLGDDKLAMFLNNGSIRDLEAEEYDFACVRIPELKAGQGYEIYGSPVVDGDFSTFERIDGRETAQEMASHTVMLEEGWKAVYVRVNGITGSWKGQVQMGVRLHLNWNMEQEKEETLRLDQENRLVNFSFMRALYDDGSGRERNDCRVTGEQYLGSYGERLAERDWQVHEEYLMRGFSHVWLKSPFVQVQTDVKLEPFTGNRKDGFRSYVLLEGELRSDEEEEAKNFSIYGLLSSGMQADFSGESFSMETEAVGVDGSVYGNLEDFCFVRESQREGKQLIAFDFFCEDSPLQLKSGVKIRIRVPVTVSGKDAEGLNRYRADAYAMIHDQGHEQIRGPAIMRDVQDFDEDGMVTEKLAFSSTQSTILDEAVEWQEYVGKYVKNSQTGSLYAKQTAVKPMEEYSYRLDFGLGASHAKNIVFFDRIERGAVVAVNGSGSGEYETIPSSWQGILKQVDTSEAETMGVVPTIWYSESETQPFELSASGWSAGPPENMEAVKAIAVSLDTSGMPDGIMKARQHVSVRIFMRAPENGMVLDQEAVNQFSVTYDAYGLSGNYEQRYELASAETRVRLMDQIGKVTFLKKDGDRVIRTDKNGRQYYAALNGASFQIYDEGGIPLSEHPVKTDMLGRLILKDIKPGTYYWEEVEAPAGYEKQDGRHSFQVTEGSQEIEILNRRIRGQALLVKRDADDPERIPPAGTILELYTAEGSMVCPDRELKTGADGTVLVEDLAWGTYYLTERQAPAGYEKSEEQVWFSIGKDNLKAEAVIANRQIRCGALLKKTDAEDGKGLKQAYYDLYRQQADGSWKKIRENLKTNAAGEIMIEELLFGVYRLCEVQPPTGYLLAAEPVEFSLEPEQAGSIIEVKQENQRKTGSAMIFKVSEDGMPLSGAVYDLFRMAGEPEPLAVKPATVEPAIGERVASGLVTDETGNTPVVEGLSWGTYGFVERSAPEGYQCSAGPAVFEIKPEQADICQTVKAVNKKVRGSVVLTKVDQENREKKLSGAEYRLCGSDGTVLRTGLVTGTDGTVRIDGLDWGSWYLEEVKAPDGYGISPERIRFSINQQNCGIVQQLTAADPVNQVQIRIRKQIDGRLDAFGDPVFLFRVSGVDISGAEHVWTTSVSMGTGEEGMAILTGIPAGRYVVRELPVSRYVQTQAAAEVDLTRDMEAEVLFQNHLNLYEKFSHTAQKWNLVNARTKLTGMRIHYCGPEIIESEVETEYRFSQQDLTATAFYDDGSSREIPFSELLLSPSVVDGNQNTSGSGYTVTVSYTENGTEVEDSFQVEIRLQLPGSVRRIYYHGNDGFFDGNTEHTVNTLAYRWTLVDAYEADVQETSSTVNALPDGTRDGGYGNDRSDIKKITFRGASEMKVTVRYQTESNGRDWVSVYNGDIVPDRTNYKQSVSGRLGGRTMAEKTFTIPGDTVQIYFTSDSSGEGYYGYYATVTAHVSVPATWTYVRLGGSVKEPDHLQLVHQGWYLEPECITEFVFDPYTELPEDLTVYAKWKKPEAFFISGSEFNRKVKKMAGLEEPATGTKDTSITAILESATAPDSSLRTAEHVLSTKASETPIYGWYESGILYWWSKDRDPALLTGEKMFCNFRALKNIEGVRRWNTSRVSSMEEMFDTCMELENLDPLSGWDTSKVWSMMHMFFNGSGLIQINGLAGWDVSKVRNMDGIFYGCSSLENLDALSKWEPEVLETLSMAFYGCHALQDIYGLKEWKMPVLKRIGHIFGWCDNLSDISPVSGWSMENISNMEYAFYRAGLENLDSLSSWNTSGVENMQMMFGDCQSLTDVSGINDWDIGKVTNFGGMFHGLTIHPEFTKRDGTWSDGTFIPGS